MRPTLPPNWQLITTDTTKVEELKKTLKVADFLCEILVQKGIHTYEEAKSFFKPAYENLHNPFLLKDMSKAVERIKKAIDNNEKIIIYGDYDSDGVCATTIIYHFLQKIDYPHIAYYIPDRIQEGYGTSDKGMQHIIDKHYNLLITVDCGIRSKEHIALLNTHNIDTIITDHHLPDPNAIPEAYAILNPKQKNCIYPFKELCGCGIVFKLLTALSTKYYPHITHPLDCIDFTALATVADMVSIIDENRIIVSLGLQKINTQPHPTLKALLDVTETKPPIKADYLGFSLGPRINAAGRISHAYEALNIFLASELAIIYKKSEQLHKINEERKKIQAEQTQAIADLAAIIMEKENPPLLILYQVGLCKGVVGLIANKISEAFGKPAIILTSEDATSEYLSGSARSRGDFNITEALEGCARYLKQFGGHSSAAGLSLAKEQLPNFTKNMYAIADNYFKNIPPEIKETETIIRANAYLPVETINEKRYQILQRMEPFGMDNPEPSFFATNVQSGAPARILKEKHLKLIIGDSKREAIGFDIAQKYKDIDFTQPFDLHYMLDENTFNGRTSLQLKILHLAQATQSL